MQPMDYLAIFLFLLACGFMALYFIKGRSTNDLLQEQLQIIAKQQKQLESRLEAIEGSYKYYSEKLNSIDSLQNKLADLSQIITNRNAELNTTVSKLRHDHGDHNKSLGHLAELLTSATKSTNNSLHELSQANKKCSETVAELQNKCFDLDNRLKRHWSILKEGKTPQRIEVEIIQPKKKNSTSKEGSLL